MTITTAGPTAPEASPRVTPVWATLARAAAVSVVYLVAWLALDVASTHLEVAEGVSIWYPPPGLDVAVLLVLGVRWWPLLVASSLVHLMVVAPGMGATSAALYTAVTVVGYVGAAAVLRHALRFDPRLPSLGDLVRLLWVAAGAAALLVCAARVLLLNAAGEVESRALVLAVASNWAGSATGIAMLTPLLLLAVRRWGPDTGWPQTWTRLPPPPRQEGGPGRLETLVQAVALLAATWLAYGRLAGASLDYTYLVYAPLLWIAVRGGLVRAAPAVLAVNVLAVLLAGRTVRRGSDGDVTSQGVAVQFGLVSLSVAALLLGAMVTQRRAEAEAHRQASLHDALTGLANRVLLDERLAAALERTRDDPAHRVGVLFCDLDGFKAVNDSLGHAAGDQVLVETAVRLRACVGPGDSVARLGGDEFAVILDGVRGDGVEQAAARVTAALAAPHHLDTAHDRIVVTVSLGSAQADGLSRPGGSVPGGAELLRDADVALHRAKAQGRNRHVGFEASMHVRAVGRLSDESALRRALDERHITVAYQPVVDLRDGSVVAAEALARWQPAGGEPVPATTFTSLAEETGLIGDLGAQVQRLAVADAARWGAGAAPGRAPRLALNVSAAELGRPGYGLHLLDVLAEVGLEAARLDVEITETVLVGQGPAPAASLGALAAAGARVVVDDFGTGFSSFAYLRSMPVTGLKIDRSFVAGLPGRRSDAAIVRAILAMAAELDLEVVAEGVSTPAQLGFLRAHGCAYGQGFLLGRPGSPGELVAAGRRPWPPAS